MAIHVKAHRRGKSVVKAHTKGITKSGGVLRRLKRIKSLQSAILSHTVGNPKGTPSRARKWQVTWDKLNEESLKLQNLTSARRTVAQGIRRVRQIERGRW